MRQKIEAHSIIIIRRCIWLIIIGLTISGITAFPLQTEIGYLVKLGLGGTGIVNNWLNTVYLAVKTTNHNYPYLSYGTDWLAFAHLMLAVLFIGPLRDPVKNIWIIEFGIIACILIFPLAFIAGSIRGIPIFWRLIDCSFGVFGSLPLIIAYMSVKKSIKIHQI